MEEWSYEKTKYWVYEGYIDSIQHILKELSCISEYYIVSKKLEWLLVENHHGCLICSGEIMVQKMDEVRNLLSKEVIY